MKFWRIITTNYRQDYCRNIFILYIYIIIKNILLGMEILLKGYFKDCSTNYEVLLERYYFTLLSQSFNHIV